MDECVRGVAVGADGGEAHGAVRVGEVVGCADRDGAAGEGGGVDCLYVVDFECDVWFELVPVHCGLGVLVLLWTCP